MVKKKVPDFLKLIFVGIILLALPLIVSADTLGQTVKFYIDSFYDIDRREEIEAILIKITPKLYFYLDKQWWDEQVNQVGIYSYLLNLSEEFENYIYPNLTSTFGSEPKPGIDKDERITILFHSMKEEAGGYFNDKDGYPKAQVPDSNQREMFYLNTEFLKEPMLKSLLAHEFLHLITFNQKEKIRGVSEEVWLNESRADYTPTFLGYDEIFEGSNLQRRVKIFLDRPYDSLIEWQNRVYDYGVVSLFTQYLVDHYGADILVDSLNSAKVGKESIDFALKQKGVEENLSEIFTDWTIALLIGDCEVDPKFCYKNKNLSDLKVVPVSNFLPLKGKGTLTFTDGIKEWSGNWYKFIGGKGVLKLEFEGDKTVNWILPYVIKTAEDLPKINFLNLDEEARGEIYISDFGTENLSLTLIPLVLSQDPSFEAPFSFSVKVFIVERSPEEEVELIKELLARIEELQLEIARIQAQIALILKEEPRGIVCQRFETNLYYGLGNNPWVRCLQEFLKNQGPEIYPEGLITGNFLSLTQQAVIRFQEKYVADILTPLGLEEGTGFVGPKTRAKINELLGY